MNEGRGICEAPTPVCRPTQVGAPAYVTRHAGSGNFGSRLR